MLIFKKTKQTAEIINDDMGHIIVFDEKSFTYKDRFECLIVDENAVEQKVIMLP